MKESVILKAVRTPLARRRGACREAHPDALLARDLAGLIERTGVDPEQSADAVNGTVTQIGEQGANVGRLAVMPAGPVPTEDQPALQVMCIGHGMSTATIIERT